MRILLILLLATACSHPAPPSAPSQPAERRLPLTPGVSIQAVLAGGESHLYRLDLPPDRFADLVVDQQGIDVVLRLTGPEGAFPEVDSPNDGWGPEPLPLLGTAGPLHLEIRSADPKVHAGHYAVRIRAVRPATDHDRAWVETEREFARAEGLRRLGGGDALRDAAATAERCALRFRSLGKPGRAADASYAAGRARNDLGEIPAALRATEEALPLFRAVGNRGAEVRALNSLGNYRQSLGDPWGALACFRSSLALTHALGDRRGEAGARHNMGKLEEALGRTEDALASYGRARDLWRQLGLRGEEGEILVNRGNLFATLGNLPRALDDLDQAMPLLSGRPKFAEALDTRGYLRLRAGRRATAGRDLKLALKLQRRAGNRKGEAVALSDLGLFHQSLGRIGEARHHFATAAAVSRELGDATNEAVALINLGRLAIEEGDASGAEAAFRRALPSAASLPEGEAAVLLGLAQVLRARSDPEGALREAEIALARIEALRTRPGSDTLRTSFFASYQDAFLFAVDTAMELHGRDPAAGYDARALELSERARARSLLDALTEAGVGRAVPRELSDHIAAVGQRRLDLLAAGASAAELAAAEREVRRSLGDLERGEARIRRALPPTAAVHPLTLEQIRRQTLDRDTVLLEYALGERRSFLWVVTSTSLHSYSLPARKVLEDEARRVHGVLAESRRIRFRAKAAAALQESSRLLLAPAADQLVGRRLMVVPDGALHLLPFGALEDPASTRKEPLLARLEVVTVPSASSLAALRRRAKERRPAPAEVAVLADPVFDAADPRVTGRTGGPPPESVRGARGAARRFPRLLSSRDEAQAVLALAPPGDRLAALGFAARRELALGGTLARFRIVHFATHGVVDLDHPELTGIALSMVDERGKPQEGFLHAYEIYRLHLPADLVVLSACETALGREVRGEGVMGLTRAFFHAGAQRVLVSLWPVEDQATTELMRKFYVGLSKGLSAAEALRQAQDALRHRPDRQAPHYWSGFVLQGDGR